jgi:hypothetical protein
LGSDDIWLPQNLELKTKLLDSRPDAALVCSDMYLFDSDTGATIGRLWHNKPGRYLHELQDGTRQPLKEFLSRGSLIGPTATIVRRQVFDKAGYFDESLQVAEDYDLYVRILQRFSIGIINMPLVRYRIHRGSLSANSDKWYPGTLAAINKIINSYSLSKGNIKFVRRKLARAHRDYGWGKIILSGDMALGRKKLIASIEVNPWCIRPYFYFVGSFLGSKAILTIKSWKKWLYGT